MEKIKCTKCGKMFGKQGLRLHELTCTGERSENVESQYRAILDGYSAYCKKCGELI